VDNNNYCDRKEQNMTRQTIRTSPFSSPVQIILVLVEKREQAFYIKQSIPPV